MLTVVANQVGVEMPPPGRVTTVGDVIITPNDMISAQKRTTTSWAVIRGTHKISKKTMQGTKRNMSGLLHRRLYANVAVAPA